MCALHFKKQFQKAAALIILLLFASAYIQAQHGVGSEGGRGSCESPLPITSQLDSQGASSLSYQKEFGDSPYRAVPAQKYFLDILF